MLRSSAQFLSRSVTARSSSSAAARPSSWRAAAAPSPRSFNMSTGVPGPSPTQSSSSSGGGGRIALATGFTVVTILGGTLAYAAADRDFRKWVEGSVPGSSDVFKTVLGDPEPPPPLAKKPLAKVPITMASPSKKRPSVAEPTTVTSSSLAVQEVVVSPPPLPPVDLPSFKDAAQKTSAETVNKEEAKGDSILEVKAPEVQKTTPTKAVDKDDDHSLLSTEDIVDLHDSDLPVVAEKDLHRRVTEIREELESQMRKQLKRQSEAHTDHLHDALEVQRRELTRRYQRELDEALEKAILAHRDEVSSLVGHVRGLDDSLRLRSTMDAATLEAQELWLACTAVLGAVSSAAEGDEEVRSLARELEAVKKVAPSSDEYVHAVLGSIPEQASTRGIHTETSIKERFLRVEKQARRTAMIGDEGGSLFKYFLSYLQSLLVLQASTEEIPSKEAPVDVDALNTFDLVWLARGCLDRGDLGQAVRYVTLLKGEPRNVAKDWLREARLLLETKQACLALMVHAAAVGVEALPQRK